MSLVEKALEKLRETSRPGTAPAPSGAPPQRDVVIGSVVPATSRPRPAGRAPVGNQDKLVVIDRKALRNAGLFPTEQAERRLAREYRQIKRPLIAAAVGKPAERIAGGQGIMIASALPGEGKTFTSINLALSMALEKDITVLLIDADVAKPHISRIFGVDQEPGLLDVLGDELMDVESVILPTDVPRLSILPAGRQTETATELLASQRMHDVAASIASYDSTRLALFDSPPLLLTSESRALASAVGQIAIVVRAGATLRSAVSDAVASLGDATENKNVGFILNQSELESPDAYYGYGDYYGKKPGESA